METRCTKTRHAWEREQQRRGREFEVGKFTVWFPGPQPVARKSPMQLCLQLVGVASGQTEESWTYLEHSEVCSTCRDNNSDMARTECNWEVRMADLIISCKNYMQKNILLSIKPTTCLTLFEYSSHINNSNQKIKFPHMHPQLWVARHTIRLIVLRSNLKHAPSGT